VRPGLEGPPAARRGGGPVDSAPDPLDLHHKPSCVAALSSQASFTRT
jgi:hypothetical protein